MTATKPKTFLDRGRKSAEEKLKTPSRENFPNISVFPQSTPLKYSLKSHIINIMSYDVTPLLHNKLNSNPDTVMKSRLFHSTVVFLLTLLVAPLCVYAQEEDILIEPPLTWSINSIQIVWSVSQGTTTTQETKSIYGITQNNSETFGKELSNEKGKTTGFSVSGGARLDGSAGMDFNLSTNPLKRFGLFSAKVNASAYVEGGFNYNQTNRTTDTSQWSESEKNDINKVLSSAFEKSSQQIISNQRLVFTVNFTNHTSSRLYFNPGPP